MNNIQPANRVGSPQRRRFSPQQIQQLLADFQRSGLSAAAFVRQHGLGYAAFCRWRNQHRAGSLPPSRWQAVPLGALLSPNGMAEIALPNGATVRVSAQASAAWSAELLRTVVRSC